MKFESGYQSAASTEDTTSKDKKKSRGVSPVVASESARALAKPVIDLETMVAMKAVADKSEKTEKTEAPEKPALEFADSTSQTPHETKDEMAENDKTIENLDADERQKVAEVYVATVTPEVVAEVAGAGDDSTQKLEATASLALLAELQARLAGDTSPEEALESAYETVTQTLGDSAEQPAEIVDKVDHTAEASPATSAETFADGPAIPVTSETSSGEDVDEPPTPAWAAAASSTNSPPPPIVGPPPAPSAGGAGGESRPVAFGTAGATATEAMGFASATAVSGERPIIRHNSQAAGLLVGGILGYLIGRRRGRIKTEKRLMPIQKKLEKQVKDLHEKIAVKEQQIRRLAHQKAESETVGRKRQEMVERLQKEHNTKVLVGPERIKTVPTPEVVVRAPEQQFQPESMPVTEKPAENPVQKVEEMNLAALLMVAESITVDKRPLRQMYESGQLDERSLRRVVQEHVRGGNVHEMVARELIAKELPFETDPALRQNTAAATPLVAGASAANATDNSGYDRNALPQPTAVLSTHGALHESPDSSANGSKNVPSKAAVTVVVVFALALAVAALVI